MNTKNSSKIVLVLVLVLVSLVVSSVAAFAADPTEFPFQVGPTSGAKSMLTKAGMQFKFSGITATTVKVTLTMYGKYGFSLIDADTKAVKVNSQNNLNGNDLANVTITGADLGLTYQILAKEPNQAQNMRIVINADVESTFTVLVADQFAVKYPKLVKGIDWTLLEINATGAPLALKDGDSVTFRNTPTAGAKLLVISKVIALVNHSAGYRGSGVYTLSVDIVDNTEYKLEVVGGDYQVFVVSTKDPTTIDFFVSPAK